MDEKLCPMQKEACQDAVNYITTEHFLPCLREKCAWWFEGPITYHPVGDEGTVTYKFTGCAILAIARRGKGE